MEGNQRETQLFLLRLWLDELPHAGVEEDGLKEEGAVADNSSSLRWRGKVQHVVRGEAHAFIGWEMMLSCLESMLLRDLAQPPGPDLSDSKG